MGDSVAIQIHSAAQSLLKRMRTPGVNLAECLNSTLNQFLTWPFRAGSAYIIDTEGNNASFDTVIYTNSETNSEDQPVKINVDKYACAIHVIESFSQEVLRDGYENIAVFKRLIRTPTPKTGVPINTTPLGIIFAVDSTVPIEKIAELMILQNHNHPSTEWPDMVAVLTHGTVNYAVQFHGGPIEGDFLLPSIKSPQIMPMYVHVFAHGLGLYSMNKMCAFLFMHLLTFSPGTKLPIADVVLEDVSPYGITFGAYQFNLKGRLVSLPDEMYSGRRFPPIPIRIEDQKGKLLSHLEFITWQGGGAVRLIGKLPLEGLLVFLGPAAKEAQIIKRSDGAISSVLNIGLAEFNELLGKIQRQTNMNVKAEKPKWTVTKMADEGTTSPFMARIFLGILRLRDVAFSDDKKIEEFDKASEVVIMTLFNVRSTAKEIIETLTQHINKVSMGEIARLIQNTIRIDESIDNKLRKQVEEFLNSTVRVLKDGMQKLSEVLMLELGFLYKKQGAFNNGIETLIKTEPELADYLLETRKWSERLILMRNELHGGWMLPKMGYKNNSGTIEVVEPQISGEPVSEFVNYMTDRLCCFVEDISVYGLETQMPSDISVTEIPISERKTDCPERFQVTFVNGGMQIWTIGYHDSKFEET
jgi:hypothetical protein